MDKEILFVLGAPRSGTTFINRLLYRHLDYGMCAEGTWVVPFARRLQRYGDLADDANLRRIAEDVSQCEMLQIFRNNYSRSLGRPVDVTPDMIVQGVPERSYAGIVYSVFANVAEQLHRSRVGNKSPMYELDLPVLTKLFPGAKYLYIVRDGRDVALSLMQQKWGQRTAYACAHHWARSVEAMDRYRPLVPEGRLLEFRYEDFLAEPEAYFEKIDGFLELDLDADRRAEVLEVLRDNPMRGNYGKWRDRMTQRELRLFESVAGAQLDRWGYERAIEGAQAAWYESAYYMGREYLRRILG